MSSARSLRWLMGARSETGYVRTANEDRMGWTRTAYGDVYVVSDGMGGYRGGAQAAELTVRTLQERLAAISPASSSCAEQVRQAFQAANQEVYQRRRPDDPDTRDMGATGVALVTSGSRILVGHVGDSRAYLWRPRRGLMRLTKDHTRVQKMLDAGLVTAAQAAVHPDASVLDRAIGHQPTVEVDVSAWTELKPGDMVLLCTDGLCGYVDDAQILKVLRARGDPQALADKLVDCALAQGGEDNVTVQLVRFGGVSRSLLAAMGKPMALLPLSAVMSAAVAWVVASESMPPPDKRTDTLALQLASAQNTLADMKQRLAKVDESAGTTASDLRKLKLLVDARPVVVAAAAPSASPSKTTGKPNKKPEIAKKNPDTAVPPAQPASPAASPATTGGPAASGPASAVTVQARSAPTPTPAAASAPEITPQ